MGVGGNAGGAGVHYMRQLGSAPLALGAGFGVLGPAAHVDFTIPGFEIGSSSGEPDDTKASGYFGVGLLVVTNQTANHFGGGELFLEGGTQTWPQVGGDWFFIDGAVGIMINLWGPSTTSSLGPSVRFQLGYAF